MTYKWDDIYFRIFLMPIIYSLIKNKRINLVSTYHVLGTMLDAGIYWSPLYSQCMVLIGTISIKMNYVASKKLVWSRWFSHNDMYLIIPSVHILGSWANNHSVSQVPWRGFFQCWGKWGIYIEIEVVGSLIFNVQKTSLWRKL